MAKKCLRIVSVRYVPLARADREPVRSSRKAATVLTRLLGQLDREAFVTLHVDAKSRLLSAEVTSVGSLTGTLVHPREVFKAAILQNAAAIIVGHNHPSGSWAPSSEDMDSKRRLAQSGEIPGIPVQDFLIVTSRPENYWSAADAGEI